MADRYRRRPRPPCFRRLANAPSDTIRTGDTPSAISSGAAKGAGRKAPHRAPSAHEQEAPHGGLLSQRWKEHPRFRGEAFFESCPVGSELRWRPNAITGRIFVKRCWIYMRGADDLDEMPRQPKVLGRPRDVEIPRRAR